MENVYSEIERELKIKANEDANYQLINNAKLRAIKEASSYEEFKKIVQTAHLTPLQRTDTNFKTSKNWNLKFNQKPQSKIEVAILKKSKADITKWREQEIIRNWRQSDVTERSEMLKEAKTKNVLSIWIETVEFGEILTTLSMVTANDDALIVKEILVDLSRTKRFYLEMSMLTRDQKQAAKLLFESLEKTF